MKIKKEYIALVLIIAVLSIYLVLRNSDRTHYELPKIAAVDRSQITRIAVSGDGISYILERFDDVWRIMPQGYPADRGAVDRMLDAAADFGLTTLVSETKNYSHYDLTDDKKISIEVAAGDKVVQRYSAGKTASTQRHTFVLLDGYDGVYQAKGNIRSVFDKDIEKLRDKSVMTVNRDEVMSITATKGSQSVTLVKSQTPPVPPTGGEGEGSAEAATSAWMTSAGAPADEKAVNIVLGAVSGLKCDSYIEGKTKEDYTKPIYTLTVEGTGKVTLSIFEMVGEKYPAISSQNDYPFFLPKWRIDQIMKDPSEFTAKESERKEK